MFNIEVNNRNIPARKGETILSALRRNGIHVPTLCNMKDLSPSGACRMCVVEIDGNDALIPSCSFNVTEGMKIKTHSPRVLKARKTIVELLLSNHPDDCLYCERNGNCELQKMAEDLNIRERRIPGKKSIFKIDKSSASIIRDPGKCILCGRCVRVCEEIQAVSTLDFIYRGNKLTIAPAMNKPLNFSNCISCGQCLIHCPTGALAEKTHFAELDDSLHDPEKILIAQYSETSAVSLAEEFSIKPGKDINGLINAALRKIGFNKVFETSFGADLLIMEQAEEFLNRLEKKERIPLITGCCPSWIRYAEQFIPEIFQYITAFKSPQQITASLIKTWIAEKYNYNPVNIYSVSVMPCIAKKMEAQRAEMTRKGISDIDTVITTRELARLIKLNGIDMHNLEPEPPDEPLRALSSAGKLFGVSGGPLEALTRTIFYKFTGKELDPSNFARFRNVKGLKELSIKMGDLDIEIAAISGMASSRPLLDNIMNNKNKYHIIEIMACPGGCINGGGQPIGYCDIEIRNRGKALFDTDNNEIIKVAHKNPEIINVYNEFLKEPGGKRSMELLSVNYTRNYT